MGLTRPVYWRHTLAAPGVATDGEGANLFFPSDGAVFPAPIVSALNPGDTLIRTIVRGYVQVWVVSESGPPIPTAPNWWAATCLAVCAWADGGVATDQSSVPSPYFGVADGQKNYLAQDVLWPTVYPDVADPATLSVIWRLSTGVLDSESRRTSIVTEGAVDQGVWLNLISFNGPPPDESIEYGGSNYSWAARFGMSCLFETA